jgi:hypothetical protein
MHFFDGMEDYGLCWHIYTHRKGLSSEQHLDEPLRKQKFYNFFGKREQITMVDGVSVHANLSQKHELLKLSILRLKSRKGMAYKLPYLGLLMPIS